MTRQEECNAIFERARTYYDRVMVDCGGQPPDTFLVSEREYALLRCWTDLSGSSRDTSQQEIWIFGMRVVKDERWPWYRDNLLGHHMRSRTPAPSVDSERSSFDEWQAGVDALLREVRT